MTGAELAARITAAKAVNDDFNREVDAWTEAGGDRPDYAIKAFRLSRVLEMLIAGLEHGADGHAETGGQLAEVRAVLAAFDWEHDDRQYALEKIDRIVTGSDR